MKEWMEWRLFRSRAPTALHIFHFPPSWKDQVIEKETIQQPRLHRCQWKASEILEYYTLGPVFVFLSHGASGKKWLYNDNTWKVLSIRLMHHCQRARWNCIVSLWMGDINGETAGWRERERERQQQRCSVVSKCKVHWNVMRLRCWNWAVLDFYYFLCIFSGHCLLIYAADLFLWSREKLCPAVQSPPPCRNLRLIFIIK